jgi:acyl-CoA thioesterase I
MSIDLISKVVARDDAAMRRGWMAGVLVAAALLLPTLVGCDAEQRSSARVAEPPATNGAPAGATDGIRADRVILFVGTSLTAGYGLPEDRAYPALVQEMIDSVGLPFRVVNAGVSGETSAGALRRIDWLLRQPFDVLVLETGANDMLRGQDPDSTRANIENIIDRVRAARPEADVVLAGMLAMPNLGREYGTRFERIYPEVARDRDLPLVPFLLDDVAARPELNLPDGIHPNEEGQRRVAETVWAVLEPVLRDAAGTAAAGG